MASRNNRLLAPILLHRRTKATARRLNPRRLPNGKRCRFVVYRPEGQKADLVGVPR